MKGMEFDFDEVRNKKSYALGIVTALNRCSYEEVTAGKLDTRRANSRVGKVLSSLSEQGFLTELDKGSRAATYTTNYSKNDGTLEKVIDSIEETYEQTISDALTQINEDVVISELLESPGFNVSETNNESSKLLNYRNNDYSIDTLTFLDEIEIIKGRNVDPMTQEEEWNRQIIGDQDDIDYVLNILED